MSEHEVALIFGGVVLILGVIVYWGIDKLSRFRLYNK